MATAVGELDVGARDEVANRARNEYLAGGGERGDSGSGVYGDPGEVVTAYFALPGVQPGSQVEAEPARVFGDRLRAADGTCGSIEGGEEPVAGSLDLVSPEPLKRTADLGVVLVEDFAPTAVTKLRRPAAWMPRCR